MQLALEAASHAGVSFESCAAAAAAAQLVSAQTSVGSALRRAMESQVHTPQHTCAMMMRA